MIETSPRTGQSVLAGGAFEFLGAATGAVQGLFGAAAKIGRGGGATTTHVSGNSPLHFHEARVYTIPGIISSTCGQCGSDTDFAVNYISDTDPLWRLAQPRLSLEIPINGLGPMGVWGKLYPRVGFLVHGSHHVAGAAAAIRAAWIAFDPLGTRGFPPDPRPLVVLQPTTVRPSCWQIGYPHKLRAVKNECFPPGVHPAYFDRLLHTPDSSMLHFLYQFKTC